MLEIGFKPRAQLDLESIYTHIALALGAPQTAQGVIDALYSAIERIAEFPESGMVFTHEDLEHSFRRVLCNQYWIYYTFNQRTLTIWRIFHTRQDIPDATYIEF